MHTEESNRCSVVEKLLRLRYDGGAEYVLLCAVQWGTPTFKLENIVAMIFVNIFTMMETVCDYHACAVVAGLPPPPPRAVNRGVFVEGLGCLLTGALGSGLVYETQGLNLGVLALTKASCHLSNYSCCLIMVFILPNDLSQQPYPFYNKNKPLSNVGFGGHIRVMFV